MNKSVFKELIKECIHEILKESYLSLDEVTHPELADTRMDFVKGKQARELIDPPQKVKTKKPIRYKIGTGMVTIPANHDILLFHSKNPQLNSYVFANEKVWCPVSKENQIEFLHEETPCWKGHKQYGTKEKNGKEVPNCIPVNEETVKIPIIKKRFS